MNKDYFESLLGAAVEFQAETLKCKELCNKRFKENEKEGENVLRILIDGLIAKIAVETTKKIETVTPEISYQIGISASFIRTHYIVFDLILEGCLIEAAVLLRKQVESLSRLYELDSMPLKALEGKVPNVKQILKGVSGKIYGFLSEIAHFSKPKVSKFLQIFEDGERLGPSLYPVFNEKALVCFDLNCFLAVYFIAWQIEKLPSWYGGYDNQNEKDVFERIFQMALACDIIRLQKDAKQ